ncbi:16S rRNA (cytidine(1402)-2'-O)-methyltransferase [Palleronia caenipelagi]|uniref:Ribosomal RNA small subunit methyltransferase I n=1 Tax=Palleronia caenipelagi TaxID=2489174 RepID=A0A547Q7D6_9RHOB|nr:16S rRNA (cytidine(1402)-2'-O)-methyltransferase [Palleronia caenipelagi]
MESLAVTSLLPGLYLVATPIGAARDITLRALDVLGSADLLAAEDTRTLRHLMEIHGIHLSGRPLIAYHDHNGDRVRPVILKALSEGKSVAYASDAGTPLVADPGYQLARAVREAGHLVTTAPGPSAALAALSLSALPSDRFLFEGFLPAAAGARSSVLKDLAAVPATLIFFEAPSRIGQMLSALHEHLGDRQAALCRELTKRFEEVRQGTLSELVQSVSDDPPRGEIVVVVDRDRSETGAADLETALRQALVSMSVKDAASVVAEAASVPRRQVYQLALKLASESGAD